MFNSAAVFVDYPYQYEALAVKYETRKFVYDIKESVDGGYEIIKSK